MPDFTLIKEQTESDIIKQLCDMMGIQKSRTTPYHASGNGMTERFNRTLISMIGTLEPEKRETGNSLFLL